MFNYHPTEENTEYLLSIIYPNKKSPAYSRFASFFRYEINKDASIQTQCKERRALPISRVKTKFQFRLNNIIRGTDDRTTVMLKNISRLISKERLRLVLSSYCSINYLYIPTNAKKKSLGFAFVNVDDCKELVKLYNWLHCKGEAIDIKAHRPIQICYAKMQGVDELIKVFGEVN